MRKVAIVTGGARGIGLGISKQLAAAGWNLMLNGVRDASHVKQILDDVRSLGTDVDYCAADIGKMADRLRLVESTVHRFGRIDALVNNAGITSPGRKDILEADEDSFDHVIAVNLKGPYFLTQFVARQMIVQHKRDATFRGTIVFVSSVSADFVSVNRGDYCLSKSALGMATQLWAARLAEFGIDVHEVRPGIIHSDMTSGVTEKYDRLIAEGLTLQRRWGEPEDVGKAVKALVCGEIPYATGQVLRVDGGMTVRRL
jgi:NAD(P)-dependent dehydrogenase (short-subunit alcohol dehydrogenase family)